jgi:hypothetical protein
MAMEAPFAQAAAPLPFNLQILRRGLDMAIWRRSALVNQWRSWRGVSVSLGDRHSPIPKGGYAHLFISQDGETPTMCHHTLLNGNFHVLLLRIDEDLAAKTQADGCRRCGEVLHKNRYQRKPRGGGLINLGKGPHFCLSLTCKMCGKRHNPPSVRFGNCSPPCQPRTTCKVARIASKAWIPCLAAVATMERTAA